MLPGTLMPVPTTSEAAQMQPNLNLSTLTPPRVTRAFEVGTEITL